MTARARATGRSHRVGRAPDAGSEPFVEIDDLDEEGAGTAPLTAPDGGAAWTVHVRGALPGERATVRVDHVSHHRPAAWASLLTLERTSADRVEPACAGWGPCGGCILQHLGYPAQVAWKDRAFRALVSSQPALAGAVVHPAVASPRALGYRNKSKLVAGRDGVGRIILGAFAPRSHDVVDLGGCAVVEPPLEAVASTLRELLDEQRIEPYDEARLHGQLRYVILRATADGAVLVVLVTAREAFPEGGALASALRAARPEVAGVVQNVNATRGNALFGHRDVPLSGATTVDDRIGNVRLRVSPQAFLQANRSVAAAAYDAILRAVAPQPGERVVDAYAGVGGIALTLAPHAGDVIGIEEHPAAVEDATASARLNGITNARFMAGDAAARLSECGHAAIVIL
ncbi:MAG TPA: 23S rRNA (uracil(1939)-C(5))-methyltransferase RlmD, partial [Polyangia bacterium]